ncbi:MAG: endonuclease/exonuclease/phosphatase family protein [Polyangiaceae bacterium]|nr:endonuclease/exonuclease/phosphatase family protein [Polyangiaceae bacterium]
MQFRKSPLGWLVSGSFLVLLARCSSTSNVEIPKDDATVTEDGDVTEDGGQKDSSTPPTKLRVAQFNIKELGTDKLVDKENAQMKAAAQIVAKFDADIVAFNEVQYDIKGVPTASMPGSTATNRRVAGGFDEGAENANRINDFIKAEKAELDYQNRIITRGNSGFAWKGDTLSNDWYVLRGWGDWAGRFNTVILSKYPIVKDEVKVLSDVVWKDLPGNHLAEMKTATGLDVPDGYPLFEKSLNIIPVDVNGTKIYLVLLHPTAPAFWSINPYRNADEIHALVLYLDGKLPGAAPLPSDAKFIVMGDLNADVDNDGDGVDNIIKPLVEHPNLIAWYPTGGGTAGSNNGLNGQYNTYSSRCGGVTNADPTKTFQMQLDYILPSKTLGKAIGGEVYWPAPKDDTSRADWERACLASDHRFVYVDIPLK